MPQAYKIINTPCEQNQPAIPVRIIAFKLIQFSGPVSSLPLVSLRHLISPVSKPLSHGPLRVIQVTVTVHAAPKLELHMVTKEKKT